jgi:hypothetical protein
MLDRPDEAAALVRRAADEYRLSWEIAPPGSWGRPIAAIRCRLIAGDDEALLGLARGDLDAYARAVELIVRSFETREVYLEDVPVANTVLVLARLARSRGMAVQLHSALLPV